MQRDRNQIIESENSFLAPYAVFQDQTGGREYSEEEHPYRIPFQRDRDRVVHSSAFKRLQYKTQVFVHSVGENYRNRLTHTLEVAGISRTIASTLGLNSLLAETIALAHDLGHTPFGHAGQDMLGDLMKDYGGFEHNKQSLRIVTFLETRYPSFPGLNLCRETIKGMMKHGAEYSGSSLGKERKEEGPSLEGQCADVADEIAYTNHDIDDGLEMGYLRLEDLSSVSLWAETAQKVRASYPSLGGKVFVRTVIRELTNGMVSNMIQNIQSRISDWKIETRSDLNRIYMEGKRIASYDSEFSDKVRELKSFLHETLYRHPSVVVTSDRGRDIIEALFHHFRKQPDSIPETYRDRIASEGLERCVCDFVAGMTDRYAEELAHSVGIPTATK
ncbi:deoxyguanosinetriphosphate triphosphohydrolase [Leptospira wolffii]|uniref:deoxyguanosinetriphosphate triphosphohydrolase n=1 Tax=Leptospira wolffii TaxID=409998 RepID=UPI0010845DE8|nr:deoxyguanosinetriphosphate triphosphohydrolase [Leptospira wolffii]TGK59962.1 deoxyguanosinetriphosphate triphosphohydrolase [Leptospira wolffii]TGK70048.1 deoxyguanosinetriphosphate triphosphohydrolase [Leptospira wolffii]TGK75970.1 deoxyguanosinetriphosphate triphosphohydrolase [Leptospira wolffii]TGL30221.1 deoxyguanosinetriphosphate triphosphohydrolase [Leptospira wolffii]